MTSMQAVSGPPLPGNFYTSRTPNVNPEPLKGSCYDAIQSRKNLRDSGFLLRLGNLMSRVNVENFNCTLLVPIGDIPGMSTATFEKARLFWSYHTVKGVLDKQTLDSTQDTLLYLAFPIDSINYIRMSNNRIHTAKIVGYIPCKNASIVLLDKPLFNLTL